MNAPTPDLANASKPNGKGGDKGGGIVRILLIGVAFVAGAGAGGFGAILAAAQLGLGGGAPHAAAPPALAHGPISYVEIDNAFTSNLVDTGRYLQLRISVSTTGGETVANAVKLHKPALVSTVLEALGELSEADVADRVGKDKLRLRLKEAINKTLKGNGEAEGVDEVFLTSLVVQ